MTAPDAAAAAAAAPAVNDAKRANPEQSKPEDGERQGKSASPGAERAPKRVRLDAPKDGEKKDTRPDRNQNKRGEARTPAAHAEGEQGEGGGRLPKRKVSVLFGYCGIGYSGLQINPGVKTIEGDIFEAFCKAGAVSKENANNPIKVSLQRAARTDRGVHAAGNLLALKLILDPPGVPEGGLVEHVNGMLPPFIRIWGITRVQGSFNARTSCDSRLYEYLLPTYVFLPPKPNSAMYDMLNRWNESEADKDKLAELVDHPFWKQQGNDHTYAEDVMAKKQWRISAQQVEAVRAAFDKYSGSHNFHNFTVGKEFRDRSCQRNMKKLEISDPKIINGTEWLSIKFHGQSFMLHQIRKMIGLLVLVGRSGAPASLIPETYGPARIHVPKAPGLGLLLEEPFFHAYNERLAETNKRPNADEREAVEYAKYKTQMEQFKQTFIYDRIMKEEEETSEFAKWLNYLDVFTGPDFEYLNPRGVIPDTAVLRQGQQVRAPGGQAKDGPRFEAVNTSALSKAAQPDSDDEDGEALKGNLAEYEG